MTSLLNRILTVRHALSTDILQSEIKQTLFRAAIAVKSFQVVQIAAIMDRLAMFVIKLTSWKMHRELPAPHVAIGYQVVLSVIGILNKM